MLGGSERITSQFIQRIEQGMGRGIRSNEDYCVVVLMGRSLISMLYAENALDMFTPATKAQLNLSEQLAKQLRGKPIAEYGAWSAIMRERRSPSFRRRSNAPGPSLICGSSGQCVSGS